MLDRSFVVYRRAWLLFVLGAIAAAIPLAKLATRDPALKPFVFVPPVVPCENFPGLGVCVAPHRDGALIVGIAERSIAAREGWRVGDLIEEVACNEIRDARDLRCALATRKPQVKVVRDGEAISYRLLKLD